MGTKEQHERYIRRKHHDLKSLRIMHEQQEEDINLRLERDDIAGLLAVIARELVRARQDREMEEAEETLRDAFDGEASLDAE